MNILEKYPISFLPNGSQALALRAALWSGERALQSWEDWKTLVDFDDVDGGTVRLLPLIYRNLLAARVQDPLMGKLKGIYRRAWYRNQLVFHRAANVMELMAGKGIDALLLKGPALVLQYYKDLGVRPMDDFDLLVRPAQASQAIAVLQESGWLVARKNSRAVEPQIPLRNSADFVSSDDAVIDLHWNLLNGAKTSDDDEEFWSRAVWVLLENVKCRALSAEDQFFHVLVHGARWNPLPPIRWVADAYTVVLQEKQFDWNRIVELAKRFELQLPLRLMLDCLRDQFELSIPADVIDRMAAIPITKKQLKDYQALLRPNPLFGFLPAIYNDYSRRANGAGTLRRMFGFLRYMQFEWDVPTLWHLPVHAISRRLSKIRKASPQGR